MKRCSDCQIKSNNREKMTKKNRRKRLFAPIYDIIRKEKTHGIVNFFTLNLVEFDNNEYIIY